MGPTKNDGKSALIRKRRGVERTGNILRKLSKHNHWRAGKKGKEGLRKDRGTRECRTIGLIF